MKSARTRAVLLTDDGLAALQAALRRKWKREYPQDKLTREIRATLFGVAVKTSDRIIANAGVDRTTLIHVFANLGEEWDDAYVELPQSEPEPEPQVDGVAPQPERFPSSEAASGTKTPKTRPWWVLSIVAALLFPMAMNWATPSSGDWKVSMTKVFIRATDLYQAGDYEEAQRLIDLGLREARGTNHAGAISGWLKVAGDMAALHGDFAQAKLKYKSAILLRIETETQASIPGIQQPLGAAEIELGEYENAKRNLSEALAGFIKLKIPGGVSTCHRDLANLALHQKQYDLALHELSLAQQALVTETQTDMLVDIDALEALAWAGLDKNQEAKKRLQECLSYWEAKKHQRWIARTKLQLAAVELALKNPARAAELAAASKVVYEQVRDRAGLKEASELLIRASRPE